MNNRLQNHYDSAPASENTGTMKGFDPEFTDIVDYIIRITYRIWEGKQVGLCYDYYGDDCPVYTLAGLTQGVDQVVQNTLDTLAAFPDRTLKAENIVWGGNDMDGYHTSHLIRTHMTNLGCSDLGPATGNKAEFFVIAHCIVKDNRIIEEWLVRDNYALVQQLGFNPELVAQNKSKLPRSNDFDTWYRSEFERVYSSVNCDRTSPAEQQLNEAESFVIATLQNIWNARMLGDIQKAYKEGAELQGIERHAGSGRAAITSFYMNMFGSLSHLKMSFDYVCSIPNPHGGQDVAVRWTLCGIHSGRALYGEPTGEPLVVLGESQFWVRDGQIEKEWTVFDELSILVEIYRARLKANSDTESYG